MNARPTRAATRAGTLAATVVALALAAATQAHAYPGQGIPNPRYPDGTGDGVVDALNNAQLDRNYRGPLYDRGQFPPPAAPVPLAYPPGLPAAGTPPAGRPY